MKKDMEKNVENNEKSLEDVSGGYTVHYNGKWAVQDDDTKDLVKEKRTGRVITFNSRHNAIDFDEIYHTGKLK